MATVAAATAAATADEPTIWSLSPGGGWCDGYALNLQRPTDWCAEAGTNITIECLSCADPNDPACAVAR
jgi:hypothetical protein